jgi:glycosyltransferase involved in cell wall biosynthesis
VGIREQGLMRIVIAVHHFPPRYLGGAEWRAHRTAQALQERGHTVQVICVEYIDRGSAAGVTWQDDVFKGVPVRRLAFNLSRAPDLFRWEYDNPWVGEHLTHFLTETRPEIFHLIGGYLLTGSALASAYALNIPVVVGLTDFWFLCRRVTLLRSDGRLSQAPVDPAACVQCLAEERRLFRWPGRILPGLMSWYWQRQTEQLQRLQERQTYLLQMLNRADMIISSSKFLHSQFVQSGVDPARITIIRQGRSFPDLTPESLEKSPSQSLRLGYLGQINEHKGVHVILEAARLLPEAALKVHIYGDNEAFPKYAARLRRLVAHDPRLQLSAPFRDPLALSRVMQNLDVIIVPSIWYENSPNTILEAFAYQTPVIAANLGGMAELVKDGVNGLLFTPGDANDLARCLRRLLTEPGLLARLRSGITQVKGVEQEMDELEAIYTNALARHRPPQADVSSASQEDSEAALGLGVSSRLL